jgi:hypothetical protein
LFFVLCFIETIEAAPIARTAGAAVTIGAGETIRCALPPLNRVHGFLFKGRVDAYCFGAGETIRCALPPLNRVHGFLF